MNFVSIRLDVCHQNSYQTLWLEQKGIYFFLIMKSKEDRYCAGYCLHIVYLNEKFRIDFDSAVLHSYIIKNAKKNW